MLIGFILGLMVGGTIGVLTAAWCVAASRSDEATPPDDADDASNVLDAAGATAGDRGYRAAITGSGEIPVVPMADMAVGMRYRDPVDELELPPPEYPRVSSSSFLGRGPEVRAGTD